MISLNLRKRINTSFLLFFLIYLILNYNFVLVYSLIVLGVISIIEFYTLVKKILNNKILSFLVNLFFTLYIYFFCFMFFFFSNVLQLKIILYSLLIGCVASDIGGFVFGKLFNGPKLTKISPNKTYSGALGGFVFAIILTVGFVIFIYKFFFIKIELSYHFILMILFLSLVSQIGDLVISYFKRKSNLENTGNLIPGHGGILDRIDGMIFVFPIFYIINQLLQIL